MATFAKLASDTNNKKSRLNGTILKVFLSENLDNWIKEAIKTRIQMAGVDAEGNQFKTDNSTQGESYSNLTIELKERRSGKSSITDHVTFYDTGQFWGTMKVTPIDGGFEIEMDFVKENGHIYKNFTRDYSSQRMFEMAIMSMNDSEIKKFIEHLNPKLLKELNGTV